MPERIEQLAYNPELVGNHMHAIAQIEERQPFTQAAEELIRNDPILFRAGVLAVRGCQMVREDQRRRAVATFDKAREGLQGFLEESRPTEERLPYEQLDGALSIYRAWSNPYARRSSREQAVIEARTALQNQALTALKHYIMLPRHERKDRRSGSITELATLAVLERQAHPWLLSTSALPHHDQGALLKYQDRKINCNFDILTTESMPKRQATPYLLQCKSDCLGMCQTTYASMGLDAVKARNKARYQIATADSGIKEISGCCDLNLWNLRKLSHFKSPLQALINEHEGNVGEEAVPDLDALSNSLILTASLPSRIGTNDRSIPLSPAAWREIKREKQHRTAIEARQALAEARHAAARAGISRIMGGKQSKTP